MDRLKKAINDLSKLEINYGAIYVYALGKGLNFVSLFHLSLISIHWAQEFVL